MTFGILLCLQLLLLFFTGGIDAFVYSCEEMKYQIINTDFSKTTTSICVVTQDGYSNWNQLKKIQLSGRSENLYDIAQSSSGCDQQSSSTAVPWKFTADGAFSLDCNQEFTVILTSDTTSFTVPKKAMQQFDLVGSRRMVVEPLTDMYLHIKSCIGAGNVNLYTGAGRGTDEERFSLRSWTCSSMPQWIFTFDNVITIESDSSASLSMEYSNFLGSQNEPIKVASYDRIAVLTSGRSDDLQNFRGGINDGEFEPHRAFIGIDKDADVTVNMDLTFDPMNNGSVKLQKTWGGATPSYYNGTYTERFTTHYFEVRYVPSAILASQVGTSQDKIIIDISIEPQDAATTTLKTTPKPTTIAPTTLPQSVTADYCSCDVDKFGQPKGWDSRNTWVDLIVILDTSEAMGEASLTNAEGVIESLFYDGSEGSEGLVTDPNAPFYSRVGVIAMDNTATILFNLNMTKDDTLEGKATIKRGVIEIDVVAAFDAALNMFNDGLKSQPNRVDVRQIIYYMTDSDPKKNLNPLNQFKTSQGVIVVNNFLEAGEVERPGLKELASPGYYLVDSDADEARQAFCKANCFCKVDKVAYGGDGTDPAVKAAGGCYSTAAAGVTFSKAKTACANGGGIVATIHDEQKGIYLNQILGSTKMDYFWFGYEKSDDGKWTWNDGSSDPYTNWDVDEPNPVAAAKCGFADKTKPSVPWGAGNCGTSFPYVCQFAPCAVGNKDC